MMFEHLRLKDHVTTQSVYVFMKSGSKSVWLLKVI